jgi:hypothetical protein
MNLSKLRVVWCMLLATASTLGVIGGMSAAAADTPSGATPHIMTIVMENTDYSQFVGSPAMPFLNELAHGYADFTQAFGWAYPSLPNYLELLSGDDQGDPGDCDITDPGCSNFTNTTLVDQLEAAGITWNAYQQGDAFGCDQSDGGGNYPYWHNPFRYFAEFSSQCSHISNFSDLFSNLNSPNAADFQWVVPDLVNSGGDNGTMSSGDTWLAGAVPQIMNSSWYRQGGQIVILFDTGYQDSGGNGGASGGQIPMVVVSARDRGVGAVSSPVNTAGVLHSIEQAYGLSFLGDAADPANGNLGQTLISGRSFGPSAQQNELGVVAGVPVPRAGPAFASAVPKTLALQGIAQVPSTDQGASGQSAVMEVGENADGEGVVVPPSGSPEPVSGTSILESVSCPSATQCYAVGLAPTNDDAGVLVSIVNGQPTSVTEDTAFIGLMGISCPTDSTCYAVGYDNANDADSVTTITSGQPGPPVEVQGGGEWLNAISCPTATTCYAAGLVNFSPAVVPITSGTPGNPVFLNVWYLNGIDCPNATTCVAVGENSTEQGIVDTVTSGIAANPVVVPGAIFLYGVGCDDNLNCVLTGAGTPGANGLSSGVTSLLSSSGTVQPASPVPGTNGLGQVLCQNGTLQGCLSVGAVFRP